MEADTVNTAFGIAAAVTTLGLSAVGSGLGSGMAASSAIGAWKKCYSQGKQAPFLLLTFVGAPLTQTLYGMILMFVMIGRAKDGAPGIPMLLLGAFAGLAIGISAWLQGRAGAAAADAQGETGQGLTNYLAALGIVETVAIFTMVFTLLAVLGLPVPAAVG